MERKHAFTLACLITALVAVNYLFFSFSLNLETAVVARVIDGDTLTLEDGRTIRLLNINSPEKGSPGYESSLNFLKLLENKSIEIETTSSDKYNRVLARIYAPNYINLELVRKGLATKFLVQNSETKEFAKAEQQAIEDSNGIWERSEFSNCITSEIDEKAEITALINTCPSIDLKDWIISDESSKTYKFPSHVIGKVNLHSAEGNDNQTDLFWGKKTNVWNNDRDTLYLFDNYGKLVHHSAYGY